MENEPEKMPRLFVVSRAARVVAETEQEAIEKAKDFDSELGEYKIESSGLCFESLEWMFKDSFLKPEIVGPIDCAEIQKHGESVFVPLEYVTPEMREGAEVHTFSGRYLARLSASGFLDCTDWLLFDDPESAIAGLAEMYD